MTRIARNRRLPLLVTIDAPLHFHGMLRLYRILLHDIAMAAPAFHLCRGVLAVTEEREIRQLVDTLRGNLPIRDIDVANLAICNDREAGQIPFFRLRMTARALQL